MIKRNPCRIKGADRERENARPVATVGQVYDLAGAVPERFRMLILLGAFTSVRWGELVNLQRSNIDTAAGSAEVTYTPERTRRRFDRQRGHALLALDRSSRP
jgi:integrase